MFGLTNSEGNHGEDVKEYYFYLDSTPTHSYAKMLYKYPQAAFPYDDLVAVNRRRSKTEFEYELLDTGIFDENRYWDVFVEFAKADPEDISHPDHRRQPRPGGGLAARPAAALVPQHLVGRRAARRAPSSRLGHHAAARSSPPGTRTLGTALSLLRRPGRAPVHRQRDQPLPAVGPAEPHRVPEGRHQRLHRQRAPERRQSRPRRGPSPRRTRSLNVRPGQSATVRLRLTAGAPAELADPFARVRPDLRRPQARGRRVLRVDHAAVAQRRRRQRHPPGLLRPAVDEAGLRLRRRAVAQRARHPARLGDHDPQPALVPHVQRRRHLDARQVGVPLVRGLGPGLPRGVAGVRRSRVRRASSWRSCCSIATSTRTASSRPTSGTSTTSTRPSTPGRRSSTTASTARAWATRRSRS